MQALRDSTQLVYPKASMNVQGIQHLDLLYFYQV